VQRVVAATLTVQRVVNETLHHPRGRESGVARRTL
jgi:hypothetical protein